MATHVLPVLGSLLFISVRLAAQEPCPPAAGQEVAAGWRAYRSDSLEAAERHFAAGDRLCANNRDAQTGLGYIALRGARLTRADSLFRLVTASDSNNADAWTGLALTAERGGELQTAVTAARRAVRINRDDATARAVLDRQSPGWDRQQPQRAVRPARLLVRARTRNSRFEILRGQGWVPFYIKGMNIGAALPGKFPSEFPPDSATYAGWLSGIAGMGANAVRLYTILPPTFYRAFKAWNSTHPTQALWLIHGVWTELPPEDNFDDEEWKGGFRQEMRRVVNLLHGSAEIPVRPGHAGGRYDADVSRWVLAYIIGREWEPYSVVAYDDAHPGKSTFTGRYLTATSAPALDRWMAEQCDYLLSYEVAEYNAIRPIAYTNWPTLDPLTHPTETTTDEEKAIRERLGRPSNLSHEYENDAIGLDANLVRPTRANPAGWFASYHAYPYYPDFMLYDPGYNRARSSEGRSNYFGYLRDLKRHHAGIPLVISEYGVPSSRGNAHFQPQGWNHGGHDEADMARIDARLTREIREAGAAGGILFAWIDEWFKKNWVVVDLEIPLENTRQWHNVMDAEQNYGVIGMYAGEAGKTPVLGGDPVRWKSGLSFVGDSTGPILTISSDESYVYFSIESDLLGPFPWDSQSVYLAIDTYHERVGQHRIPDVDHSEIGFEFLVELHGPDNAQVRILPDYNPYGPPPDSTGDDLGRFYHRPATIMDRGDGAFDSLYVTINRARYARDGTFFPARGYNRGRLRYGTQKQSSLSDWYYDSRHGLLEIRLPWMLLNVTDPSTRTVLFDTTGDGGFGTAQTPGWHVGVIVKKGSTIAALPALDRDTWRVSGFPDWTWKTWERPNWYDAPKPAYDAMRRTWNAMP